MPYRMPTVPELSEAKRAELQGWSRRRKTAQHHEPPVHWIPGAEVQVAEPSRSPAMTPLGGEDHQVERARDLHLQPLLTAPARGVRGGQRFHHQSLVAAAQGLVEKMRGGFRCRPHQTRYDDTPGDGLEPGDARILRRIDQ